MTNNPLCKEFIRVAFRGVVFMFVFFYIFTVDLKFDDHLDSARAHEAAEKERLHLQRREQWPVIENPSAEEDVPRTFRRRRLQDRENKDEDDNKRDQESSQGRVGERESTDEGDNSNNQGIFVSYIGFILISGATPMGFAFCVCVGVIGCIL